MSTTEANWPHKNAIAINPAKRKELLIGVAVLGAVTLLFFNLDKVIQPYLIEHQRDLLMPKMSELVAEGKPDAVIWMMFNSSEFRAADPHYSALRKAAESGHPHSMYLYAQVLLKKQKDFKGGKAYLDSAAAAGYPPALMEVLKEE